MWMIIVIILGIALYTDHTRRVIPNWLNVGGAAAGIILQGSLEGMQGLIKCALGFICLILITLILYLCKAIEAGDVKLFAALGIIAGIEVGAAGLIYSILFAGLLGLCMVGYRKIRHGFKFSVRQAKLQFPFMYAVAPGFIMTFISAEVWIS